MAKWGSFIFLCMGLLLSGLLAANGTGEDAFEKRARAVYAHLLLKEPESALVKARELVDNYKNSALSHAAYLDTLATLGQTNKWLAHWKECNQMFEGGMRRHELIENLAWGVLNLARTNPSQQIRAIACIGAALAKDVNCLVFIKEGLNSTHVQVRATAVELASLYGDACLQKLLIDLFYKEKSQPVRIAILNAFKTLKIQKMRGALIETLSSRKISAEEKVATIEALAEMTEALTEDELNTLIQNDRAIVRVCGIELMIKSHLKRPKELLILSRDSHPEVRCAALKAIGVMRLDSIDETICEQVKQSLLNALEQSDPLLCITASWLAQIMGLDEGEENFRYWIHHPDVEVSSLAAAALAATGRYGVDLACELLEAHDNLFVRTNLALALIGQRKKCELACKALVEMQINGDMWMETPYVGGLFVVLSKSKLKHQRAIANYPKIADQIIHLQICQLLAMVEYPDAATEMKNYLKKGLWQVTGLAAEMLLEEAEEDAIVHIRPLLEDSDPFVRTEAAIVLATWGRDGFAQEQLMKSYKDAPLERKVRILEAISRLKEKKMIPFLVECLQEPSLILRVIASSVLLQTLNG